MRSRPSMSTLGDGVPCVRLCLTALLVLASLSSIAEGQVPGLATTPAWYSQVGYNSTTAWGDVDGDGDLDLACGSSVGANTFYLNESGALGATPAWTSATPYTSVQCLAWGDVDGDGDLDLVCGSNNYTLALYLNQGGTLTEAPAWSSAQSARTYSVAWGDVDGDGDLDLACGNINGPSTLYRNDGGTLAAMPAWFSAQSASTYSVAWGDVDGDGDLDLACGNSNGSNTLYRNEGGTLTAAPAWSSAQSANTISVAWGDVDGDGDLDLACGNSNSPNTLYLNDGGALAATPAWSSAQPANTRSVAWGDADGDGDLDLACGNYSSPSTVFLNDGGALAVTPAWSTAQSANTNSLAWGDVDGDGDLDLACANAGVPSTLYLNEGSILAAAPAWTPAPSTQTLSMAWGDVDGDGDPDLACGNWGAPTTMYLNEGGTLAVTPAWSSARTWFTRSVAWGDVDDDGDLDLACGNSNAAVTLYLNDGGTLAVTPAWSSAQTANAYDVAWGDVDGDGDLDLAVGDSGSIALYLNDGRILAVTPAWTHYLPGGNAFQRVNARSLAWGDMDGDGDLDLACGAEAPTNAVASGSLVFLNEGGSLASLPAWTAAPSQKTLSVAWGDVDGDGDPDLACAFNSNFVTLYLNEGGALALTPAWSSALTAPNTSVAWGDADGDGDLDLACGNNDNAPSMLYLNDGGTLAVTPAWSSASSAYNSEVAWGDADGDGDLDLACATMYGPKLHSNMQAPVFPHPPAQPIHQLPNNGAHLRFVRVTEVEPNLLRISFQAVDVESDAVFVTPQYQFEGDPQWHALEIAGGGVRVGPLASSPEGISGSCDWDVLHFPFDRRAVVLRLLVTEIPSRAGLIQYGASYLKRLDLLTPHRPHAFVPITSLNLPAVTLGDTASVSFTLTNEGDEVLQISDIQLPSAEMAVTPPAPFQVSPQASTVVTVSLMPRTDLSVAGNLVVTSNDPLAPAMTLPIEAEILALAFNADLLRSESSIPLGEAATVIVIPGTNVVLERGALYFRPAGSSSGFTALDLAVSEFGFTAVIPGASVTEAGLEYYIEVENSGVFAAAPPDAPAGWFNQPVQPPSTLAVSAQSNSEGAFPQLREIPLRLEVTVGADIVDGRVFYRPGGAGAYDSTTVTGAAPALTAIIPAAAVGSRGVEYYARLQTQTTVLTSPAGAPVVTPHGVQVRMASVVEPLTHPVERYRLFSIPLTFPEDFTGSLVGVLGGLGLYDPVQWRSFRYEPGLDASVEISTDETLFRPEPGRGFWLIARTVDRLTVTAASFSTPTTGPYAVALAPGWNQVGNPFIFPVAWDAVLRAAEVEDPVAFDPALGTIGQYSGDPVAVLVPFEGYFVYNAAAVAETLRILPVEAPATLQGAVTSLGTLVTGFPKSEPGGWRLNFTASTPTAADEPVVVGIHDDAAAARDRRDRRKAPTIPGRWARLAIDNRAWTEAAGLYVEDARPTGTTGHRWDLVFRSCERGEVATLRAGDMAGLPAGVAARLIDLEQGTAVDLREAAEYRFVSRGPDRDYRLVLLAGEKAFVDGAGRALAEIPGAVVLDANAPNPFNPLTRIRFGLPASAVVSLAVFDVRGQKVATLVDAAGLQAGYHSVLWEGCDDQGRRVASGTYFYRLTAPEHVLTRKMTLLK